MIESIIKMRDLRIDAGWATMQMIDSIKTATDSITPT
jgi:hypothetical protein